MLRHSLSSAPHRSATDRAGPTTIDDQVRQLRIAEPSGRFAKKLQTCLKHAVLVFDVCRPCDYADNSRR